MNKQPLNLKELYGPDIYEHIDKVSLKLEDFVNFFFLDDKFKNYSISTKTCVAQMNLVFYYLKYFEKDQNFREKHKLLRNIIDKRRFLSFENKEKRLESYIKTKNPEYLKYSENSLFK